MISRFRLVSIVLLLFRCIAEAAEKRPLVETKPVELLLFTDYQCPFCARLDATLRDIAAKYGDRVHLETRNLPLPMHENARLGAQAALAARSQGKFDEMTKALFADQSKLRKPDLLQRARLLGLDLSRFERDLESEPLLRTIEADLAEARALGISSTPTLFINGTKLVGAKPLSELQTLIDSALGITPTQPTGPVLIDLASARFRGAKNAPITLIAFLDLQCPFCAKVAPTLRQLVADYPTQVRLAIKHFPLPFHPEAALAHEALAAAGEQGKFWEMYDALTGDHPQGLERSSLLQAGEQIGLDMLKFTADLDSRKFKSQVDREREEGSKLGVDGTPTFFLNGRTFDGAKPLPEFENEVEAELGRLKIPVAKVSVPARSVTSDAAGARAGSKYPKGPENAPLTITWFSDVRSSLTPKAMALLNEIQEAYAGKVRIIVRHRPLETRPASLLGHEALLAAGAQGKFWEMHAALLADQRDWSEADLLVMAQHTGLDLTRFQKELRDHTYGPVIDKDLSEARRREVRGSPVFFVNDKRVDGLQPLAVFQQYMEPAPNQALVAGK